VKKIEARQVSAPPAQKANKGRRTGQTLGRKGNRTRRRLMTAGLQLLRTQSAVSLTSAAISREAGASSATFYVYFNDVEELVFALAREATEDLGNVLSALEDWLAGQPAEQGAHAFVGAYRDYWNKHRPILLLRNMEADRGDRRFQEMRSSAGTLILRPLADLIKKSHANETLTDEQALARAAVIFAAIERMAATETIYHDERPMPSFDAIRQAQVALLASLVEPMGMIKKQESTPATESRRAPRAVLVEDFGPPSSFRLVTRDPGSPGPGEVRLRVHAAGISFVDVLITEGGYQIKPELPFVPGSDVSGVIEAVGEGVEPSRIGERVCAAGFGGAFAEAALFRADAVHRMPDSMSFEEGSIFLASYTTGYHALVQRAQLQAGESLLVLGAAGAVGYAACEIGKALGARVIASASTNTKRDLAIRAGADAVVDSRSPTWRDDLKHANEGKLLDVVFDPVGDVFTEPAIRSLGWKGRLLVIGFAGGTIAKIPANLALLKGAAMIGVNVGRFDQLEPDLARQNVRDLFSLYERGCIHPPVAKSFLLDDFAEAMTVARSGQLAGRVVLKIRD